MRCARRQNDAAYQQYRRRSVSGRHAIIIHRRQVQHQSSRGMFLTLWMARLPLRHRPVVLRSPVTGSESAIGRGCIRATGWDAFLLKPLLRVPYVYSAYRTQPKYNILTSTQKNARGLISGVTRSLIRRAELNSVYAEIDSGTAAPCLAGAVGQRFWLEPFNCIMCFVPSARTQAISLVFASPCSGAAVRSAATLPVI